MYGGDILNSFANPDTTLVVVPGTDDRGGCDIRRWLGGEYYGKFRDVIVIDHPAEIRGLVRAKPSDDGSSRYDSDSKWYSFDQSSDIARRETVSTVESIDGPVVVIGFSMGAYAAYLAGVDLARRGLKAARDIHIILWAHPQHSTGMKQGLKRFHPLVSRFFRRFGDVSIDGAIESHAHGEIEMCSISLMGDPVTGFECWYRNFSGWLINGLLGFFLIHAGVADQGAARVHEHEVWGSWKDSVTGIEHVVLSVAHPLRLLEQALLATRHPSLLWLRVVVKTWCLAAPRHECWYEVIAPRTIPGQRYARVDDVRGNMALHGALAPAVQLVPEEGWTPDEPLAPAS